MFDFLIFRTLNERLNYDLMIFNEREQKFKSIFSLEQFRSSFSFLSFYQTLFERLFRDLSRNWNAHSPDTFSSRRSSPPARGFEWISVKSTVCRYSQTPTTT